MDNLVIPDSYSLSFSHFFCRPYREPLPRPVVPPVVRGPLGRLPRGGAEGGRVGGGDGQGRAGALSGGERELNLIFACGEKDLNFKFKVQGMLRQKIL